MRKSSSESSEKLAVDEVHRLMTSVQVVETSITNNSSPQNYSHPDDHTIRTTDTPGFKPFTMYTPYYKMAENTLFVCTYIKYVTGNWPWLPHFKPKILLNSADASAAMRAN